MATSVVTTSQTVLLSDLTAINGTDTASNDLLWPAIDAVWSNATTNCTLNNISSAVYTIPAQAPVWAGMEELTIDGDVRRVVMPDGTVLHVDELGNYRLEDKNAKVTYRASRMRNFNPYVNAGDLLGRFIDYVRETVPGIRRSDIPNLPLQLFVHWLILEAASQDGDPVPDDVVPVPESRLLVARVRPQCRLPICRRFIPRITVDTGFNYCNPVHAAAHGKLLAA